MFRDDTDNDCDLGFYSMLSLMKLKSQTNIKMKVLCQTESKTDVKTQKYYRDNTQTLGATISMFNKE